MIVLNDEEGQALRALLAALSVLEDRGFNPETHMLEITRETWRFMLDEPKRVLRDARSIQRDLKKLGGNL